MQRLAPFHELDGDDVKVSLRDLPRDFDPGLAGRVANYLDSCPTVVDFTEASECALGCGEILLGCSSIKTDGEWVWRTGLSHYVRIHRLRLEDRFLRRLEARNGVPLAESEITKSMSDQLKRLLQIR